MTYAKTSHSGIVKNIDTHVVINTNDLEYKTILERRRQLKQSQAIESQIDSLRTEFLELKEMLKQVLSGRV